MAAVERRKTLGRDEPHRGKAGERVFAAVLMAMGLAAAMVRAGPASAHHSFAMFDQTKTVTLQGSVSSFEWTNPHAFVIVNVPDQAGQATRYTLECSSPALMRHAGWSFRTLKAGDRVTVAMHPLRDGKRGGMLATIRLPGGATLKGW
jgi:hypothetical protein